MTNNPKVPPWDGLSDGCSALPIGPLAMRRRFNLWLFSCWPEARVGCEQHDEAYHYGGSRALRLKKDDELMVAWERVGVPRSVRVLAYRFIRFGGGPKWRTPGVSWSFGGSVFKYTEPTP